MSLKGDFESLFRGQRKLFTDKELSMLSVDLCDDPQFVVLTEEDIQDIRSGLDKHLSRKLLTYVRLLDHQIALQNPHAARNTPENNLVRSAMMNVMRMEEQMELLHEVVKGGAEIEDAYMTVIRDDTKHGFHLDLSSAWEVIFALIEHLDEEVEYRMPVKDIDDIHRQDRIDKYRRLMMKKIMKKFARKSPAPEA